MEASPSRMRSELSEHNGSRAVLGSSGSMRRRWRREGSRWSMLALHRDETRRDGDREWRKEGRKQEKGRGLRSQDLLQEARRSKRREREQEQARKKRGRGQEGVKTNMSFRPSAR
jgi:hypothetical protein